MTIRRSLALTPLLLALALAGCREAPPPPPPASAPRIVSFKADAVQVNPGTAVKLSYEVEDATSIELVDDSGAFVELTGDISKGSATVKPLSTHFYVLRVSGRGGRDSAFLQVAVGEPLKDVFLIAVPPVVNGGQDTQLLWGAPRNVSATITSSTGDSRTLTGDSGSETFTPTRTTSYTLVADPGTGAPKLSAAVQVQVKPVINAFEVKPRAAHAGETLKVTWKTAGGTRLLLTEATFGTLTDISDEAMVADGSYDFVIPMTLPNGANVADGLPLRLTLRVIGSAPEAQALSSIPAYVGSVPEITAFTGPAYSSENAPVTLQWKTIGAQRVAILVSGQPLFESLPNDAARVADGSITLPSPASDTTYELVATNALGASSSKTFMVQVVRLPAITAFNAPASITANGGSATLSWTTTNATTVTITTESGANIYATSDLTKVAGGTVDVNLGQDTTFTLVALNAANDKVTMSKTTLVPPGALFFTDAGTSLPNIPIEVHYDFSGLQIAQVSGIPDPNYVSQAGSTAFVDLSTKADAVELSFANPTDGTASFTATGGFAFPFFRKTYSTFHVRVDGVLRFSPQPTSSANNTNLPAAALGQALAPYWDQLALGSTGKVRWWLDPSSFPRKLIVSWTNLERSGVAGSDVTFQVQLSETGAFKFVYGTLTGTNALGEESTIGVSAPVNGWNRQVPSNAGTSAVASDMEIAWFEPTGGSGSFVASFPEFTRFPVYAQGTTGRWMVLNGLVRVFSPNSIGVSEAMPSPEASVATTGQWVELQNNSSQTLDVGGLVLKTTTSTTGFEVPPLSIAPGAVLLLGQSTDLQMSGEAPVQYAYSDVPMASTGADTVSLVTGNGTVSSLAWTSSTAGYSISGPQPFAYTGDGGAASSAVPLSCPPSTTFNQAMTAYGTPGQPNELCIKYKLEPITSAYEDISTTGSVLFASNSDDEQYASLSLGPTAVSPAFTYFGQAYNSLTISMNGWISVKPLADAYFSNRVSPAAGAGNNGLIAPYWDDIDYIRPTANVYYKRVNAVGSAPGYLVIAWHNVEHFSNHNDVMEIEAKLFDNGVIEFHYGTMTSGDSSNYANGNAATVWIEQPNQARALVIGRDQAVLTPNSAYRFTPVP